MTENNNEQKVLAAHRKLAGINSNILLTKRLIAYLQDGLATMIPKSEKASEKLKALTEEPEVGRLKQPQLTEAIGRLVVESDRPMTKFEIGEWALKGGRCRGVVIVDKALFRLVKEDTIRKTGPRGDLMYYVNAHINTSGEPRVYEDVIMGLVRDHLDDDDPKFDEPPTVPHLCSRMMKGAATFNPSSIAHHMPTLMMKGLIVRSAKKPHRYSLPTTATKQTEMDVQS